MLPSWPKLSRKKIKIQQNLDKVVKTLALNLLSCIGLSEEQVSSNMYKLARLEKQVPAIGANLIDLQDTLAREFQIRNQMFEGLSISDEWAGNVDGTIADLTGTLEFHEAQLNIVLGKLNNLQTRMNTVMPRTEKMDKEFSPIRLQIGKL